jgi:hypothetical protein
LGFRMITLAAESQALRRGAGEYLNEATAQETQEIRAASGTSAGRGYN